MLPYCEAVPGPDYETGGWNTGHLRDKLLLCLDEGMCCCQTYLSPAALGGWTPLIVDDVLEQENSGASANQWSVD